MIFFIDHHTFALPSLSLTHSFAKKQFFFAKKAIDFVCRRFHSRAFLSSENWVNKLAKRNNNKGNCANLIFVL